MISHPLSRPTPPPHTRLHTGPARPGHRRRVPGLLPRPAAAHQRRALHRAERAGRQHQVTPAAPGAAPPCSPAQLPLTPLTTLDSILGCVNFSHCCSHLRTSKAGGRVPAENVRCDRGHRQSVDAIRVPSEMSCEMPPHKNIFESLSCWPAGARLCSCAGRCSCLPARRLTAHCCIVLSRRSRQPAARCR